MVDLDVSKKRHRGYFSKIQEIGVKHFFRKKNSITPTIIKITRLEEKNFLPECSL